MLQSKTSIKIHLQFLFLQLYHSNSVAFYLLIYLFILEYCCQEVKASYPWLVKTVTSFIMAVLCLRFPKVNTKSHRQAI